jgi:hypothetical protein
MIWYVFNHDPVIVSNSVTILWVERIPVINFLGLCVGSGRGWSSGSLTWLSTLGVLHAVRTELFSTMAKNEAIFCNWKVNGPLLRLIEAQARPFSLLEFYQL